jgi:hypothetical protein
LIKNITNYIRHQQQKATSSKKQLAKQPAATSEAIMGGHLIVGIKSIAKLVYMMNEDTNKKGKNYYGKQIMLDYDKFVKENKETKAKSSIDFDELADEFIAEYIKD